MDIIISSEANVPTPPAGYVTLFINTDKNNLLYAKYPDGTFKPYNGDSDAGDIAKMWTDRVTCAFKDGFIKASDFEAIMGQGFSVTSTTTVDTHGNPITTVTVGSRSGS
jgi:hypothetical protein